MPDVNAETYPFHVVQHLLDQTASIAFYAVADEKYAETASLTPDNPADYFGINGGYGLNLCCHLYAFESMCYVRGQKEPLRVAQALGPCIGTFRCVLLFAQFKDEALHWNPGQDPPPAMYDRWRSQRFILTDSEFKLAEEHGFRGYAIGRTYPISVGGRPRLLAGAVGNLTEGSGSFRNKEMTFVMSGTLTPGLGFNGLITCRLVDPEGDIRSEVEPPEMDRSRQPPEMDTFIVLRGEKKDRTVRTTFGPKPAPDLDSLVTPSQMRSIQHAYWYSGGSPRAGTLVGPVVAKMEADVQFNLRAKPGTADAPGPFTTREVYEFVDACGTPVGTIRGGVVDGISFGLRFPAAPGQPGVRFAGFGPITGGTGPFSGVQGILTVNSVIGIAPHTLSLTHVLHLTDPGRRFRSS
jgi:hypothetical protein